MGGDSSSYRLWASSAKVSCLPVILSITSLLSPASRPKGPLPAGRSGADVATTFLVSLAAGVSSAGREGDGRTIPYLADRYRCSSIANVCSLVATDIAFITPTSPPEPAVSTLDLARSSRATDISPSSSLASSSSAVPTCVICFIGAPASTALMRC
ncbi:hypothetical protein D3C79_733390 [compost metagenome]